MNPNTTGYVGLCGTAASIIAWYQVCGFDTLVQCEYVGVARHHQPKEAQVFIVLCSVVWFPNVIVAQ
jgi:hypothetical protein